MAAAADRRRPLFPQVALVWRIIFGTLFLITLLLGGFTTLRPVVVLPRIRLAPGFNLVDQTGAQLSNEDLRGSIALYNFTYADCADTCPQTSPVMAEVQALTADLETGNIPIRLVTMTIDPERDTAARLADYAARFEADPETWHFVTGSPVQLKSVIGGGFHTYYTEKEGGIKFDPAFMLVDGNGILRAEYRTAVPDIEIILRDIGLLLAEAQNSDGPQKLAYEAAHLFLCYPDS